MTLEKICPGLNVVSFLPGKSGFGEREHSLAQAFIGPHSAAAKGAPGRILAQSEGQMRPFFFRVGCCKVL